MTDQPQIAGVIEIDMVFPSGVFKVVADWTDIPPCGTPCELCVGHFCPAKGYLGARAVCRACGEGKTCDRTIALLKAQKPISADDLAPAPVIAHERRCTECKGKLGDQSKGPTCWPCTKRLRLITERAAKTATRELATRKVV